MKDELGRKIAKKSVILTAKIYSYLIVDGSKHKKAKDGRNRLISGQIDEYEYLTSKEIFPSDQNSIMEQVKFTNSAVSKAFEKQIKTIEDRGEKQIKAMEEHERQS